MKNLLTLSIYSQDSIPAFNYFYNGQITESVFSLDVSHWLSGFYSIVVKDVNGNVVYKSSTKIKN